MDWNGRGGHDFPGVSSDHLTEVIDENQGSLSQGGFPAGRDLTP
jgi:hypothetical protein